MKKTIIAVVSALVLGLCFYAPEGNAQMGPGMMGQGGYWCQGYGPPHQGGWNFCPYCGRHMGPGMMGPGYGYLGPGMMHRHWGPGIRHHGWGMGPGMMGRGYGMGPGYGYGPQYGPQYEQPPQPFGEKDVKAMLENYVKSTRNPNLKLGAIKEKESSFEAEILTKDDSLVDKIEVDKTTGWMRSVY